MAQDSKRVRKYRRQSRELNLAYRAIDMLARERNQGRLVIQALQKELAAAIKAPKTEPTVPTEPDVTPQPIQESLPLEPIVDGEALD